MRQRAYKAVSWNRRRGHGVAFKMAVVLTRTRWCEKKERADAPNGVECNSSASQ